MSALPISENMFGKMRGRFSDDGAMEIARGLPLDALRNIQAMPQQQRHEFVLLFNEFFWDKATHQEMRIALKGEA